MKLQNLTVIFIIIILPIIILQSVYITNGIKTIKYQTLYDNGLLNATHDAIYAFELNTANDIYSGNAETKRENIKSSIKLFERSLSNTCGISAYNTSEIEDYIPVLAFCLYDGFYAYASSLVPEYKENTTTGVSEFTGNYINKHNLKSYVYYSEKLTDDTVIRYSLDSYVTVSGNFGSGYETKSGYLINNSVWKIDTSDADALAYYNYATAFTTWFNDNIADNTAYGEIDENNDPENPDSAFVQHKRKIMKEKIETVLNSTISAYAERTWGNNFKMPKISEEYWERIYNDVAMISFFQGKSIGLTEYNGYCVLNSNNSNEYVNPNLIYFVDSNGEYHDIRCSKINGGEIGYKLSRFNKIEVKSTDASGNVTRSNTYEKLKKVDGSECIPCACYECINGSLGNATTVYNYVKSSNDAIKISYWTALARERYNHSKLTTN